MCFFESHTPHVGVRPPAQSLGHRRRPLDPARDIHQVGLMLAAALAAVALALDKVRVVGGVAVVKSFERASAAGRRVRGPPGAPRVAAEPPRMPRRFRPRAHSWRRGPRATCDGVRQGGACRHLHAAVAVNAEAVALVADLHCTVDATNSPGALGWSRKVCSRHSSPRRPSQGC